MGINFRDLNKACMKDRYPLPQIDQLVDATTGREMLIFMDAYLVNNHVWMHLVNEARNLNKGHAFTVHPHKPCTRRAYVFVFT